MKTFIREKADNGPASHVKTNGKFQTNLIEPSAVVTNERDQILCPTKKEVRKHAGWRDENKFAPESCGIPY